MSCTSLDAIAFALLVIALGQTIRSGIDLYYAWYDWRHDR